MRKPKTVFMLTCLASCLIYLAGCDKEIGSSRDVDVDDDGTVTTKEKSAVQHPDGSTTVTEEKTKTETNP
jgi:hypothetical protein